MFENGCYILVVSEPRFRRFNKMILKLFVNDFENFLQSKISELHELTFQSVFGSLRATICSWSLLYICIPISYDSIPIGINSFG